jgi:hypothetical protein
MRNVVSAMFVASWLAVGAAAQDQQPVTKGQPATQGQKPAAAEVAKVTISGCIQSAAPPLTEAAAPSSTAPKFELTNAKVISGGPVGTAGTTSSTRYRLEAEEKTISPHLTHQVELTGTIGPALPSATAGAAAVPLLKVESLKMVAAKCS